MDILTYINRMNQIYGNEPAPVRYNTQQYLQGGRVGYQGGQLVDHGPGRQGYAGDTAGFRKDIITFKGKELPKGFILEKANEFGINRKTASMIIDELRPDIRKLPYPENKEAKRKRLVVEKRLKKNFLNNAEFIKLHKNFEGSDLKFAEFLNEKGLTTNRGGKFTEGAIYSRRNQLNLKTKTLPQSMSSYKTEAEKLGIDIKGLDDETIKYRVREKRRESIRQQKRLTDPDFAARETATRKAWEKANPEKIKAAQFKSKVKSYENTGMIQAVKDPKEELWRGLFEDGKKYESRINRNLPARLKMVGDYGRYVSRERFLDAKIIDTKTGKTITFKNLENYINPKNTGKTYAQVIKPFNQKWFVNDTPGLRTEINSKLIPNWTAASKDNFFQIQHNAGRYKDPFDVSLSNKSLNLKESHVRTKFEKMWNASDNLSDKKKAFKFYKEKLPNEILSKPSMVTRSRYFGEEVPLDKQLRTLKKESGVNIPRGTLKNAKNVANILSNSGIKCALANGINCNDPRAYIKSINELKSKAAVGDKAAFTKFKKVANAMRKFKGVGAVTGWGILGEIGFALPFAAMDYADGKSTAQIMNNASLGLFGMNEEEEAISYLPKDSLGGAIPSAMRAGERIEKLEDPSRVFPKGRMGMDENRFQKAQAKVIADAKLDLTDKVSPFLEGPRNEFFNDERAAKAYGELEIAKAKLKADELQRAKERVVTPFEGIEFKEGGRVSFKFGGIDKGRRTFLKILAALGIGTATAGTGLIKLGGKAASKKVAVKAGADIVAGTQGMPSWFPALVNKIIKEGDDVTAKLATQERQVVHTKKIDTGSASPDDVTIYRDLDTGDIRVEVDSVSNMGEAPIQLDYKAPSVIDEGKMKGKKTKSEFSASESEPSYEMTSPDDAEVNWDRDNIVGNVDDLMSDTTKLKNYAEGKEPTLKEIVTRKRKTDEVNKLNTDSSAQVDYSVNKFGEGPDYDDYLPDIDDID